MVYFSSNLNITLKPAIKERERRKSVLTAGFRRSGCDFVLAVSAAVSCLLLSPLHLASQQQQLNDSPLVFLQVCFCKWKQELQILVFFQGVLWILTFSHLYANRRRARVSNWGWEVPFVQGGCMGLYHWLQDGQKGMLKTEKNPGKNQNQFVGLWMRNRQTKRGKDSHLASVIQKYLKHQASGLWNMIQSQKRKTFRVSLWLLHEAHFLSQGWLQASLWTQSPLPTLSFSGKLPRTLQNKILI